MSEPRPSALASQPAPRVTFHRDERGLSTMEYSVLFVVLLVGAILAWRTLGERMIAKVGAGTATLAEELTIGEESRREPSPAFGDSPSTATAAASSRGAPPGPSGASRSATTDAARPAEGASGFLSRATKAVRDSTLGQYTLGAAYGLLQGRAPMGFLAPSPNPSSRAFEIGRGAGELGGGLLQMAAGAGIATGGGAATLGSVLGAPATLGASLVVAPAGAATTVAGAALVATGAASVLDGTRTIINAMSMSGEAPPGPPSSPGAAPGARTPHRQIPRIDEGNLKEGWTHIDARHVSGTHPQGAGDLFAPGTTRAQIEQASREVVAKGTRISDPTRRIQTFEHRMKVNGRRDRVRVTVDADDGNRVITVFPVRSQ